MSEGVRTDFSRSEQIGGLAWLSAGAALSLLLEVVYLGTWVHIGSIAVPFPWTIAVAFAFNGVLTRTATLWTSKTLVAAIPLIVWIVGFMALLAFPSFSGDQMLGDNARVVALLFAGIAGGLWPIRASLASII